MFAKKKNVDIVIVIVVVLNVLEVLINVVNGVLKKYKECVIVSIPPEYRNKCWNYFTHSFIDKCLGECVYFKSVTAWKKETVEQEDKREEEQTTEEN